MTEQLEARKQEIEREAGTMIEERKKLQEQVNELNRKISLINGRLVSLDGAYKEIVALIKPPAEKPAGEAVNA